MIKKVTKEFELVFCDFCEQETGYEATQGYAKEKYHVCHSHKNYGNLLDQLKDYPTIQNDLFRLMLKEYKNERLAKEGK